MSDERAIEMFSEDDYKSPFDFIMHTDDDGNEFWYARELMGVLEYTDWRNFRATVKRAMQACAKKEPVENHFVEINEMVALGSGSIRSVESYKLSRMAAYLTVMNGDPSKDVVGLAQRYFAAKVNQAEDEDRRRKLNRGRAVTGYVNEGRSVEWANQRVDSKGSVKHLNGAAQDTHETNSPDYGALHGEINQGLLLMSRKEVIAHLGLNNAQAEKFRDHLGGLALETLTKANHAIAIKMKKMGRPLTADEQLAIVRDVVAILGPSMRSLAEFIEIDFVSGAPLDEYGQPLITRNLPLLGAAS